MRRLAGGALIALAFVLAPSAFAQASGSPGPASTRTTLSPPGEALAYGANPARTGEASERDVFGPLYEDWSVSLGGSLDQPLVAGGKVLMTRSTSGQPGLVALDASNGKIIWEQPRGGAGPIAAASGVVVSAGPDGMVRAFSIADGMPLWSKKLSDSLWVHTRPVADADAVYVLTEPSSVGDGTLWSLSLRSGARRWAAEVPVGPDRSGPALDDERVYVGDGCTNTAAYRKDTGLPAWPRDASGTHCRSGAYARVAGEVMFGGDGSTYSAATGTEGIKLAEQPQVVADGIGFQHSQGTVTATAIESGAERWSAFPGSGTRISPLLVGATLYVVTANYSDGRILGLGRSTGEVLSEIEFLASSSSNWGFDAGLAAGAGALFRTDGSRLIAYRAVLEPAADGADIAADRFDLVAGKRVRLVGGLGWRLRGKDLRVELRAQPAGSRRQSLVETVPSHEDGTAYYRVPVVRNTRFRIAYGAAESRSLPVFAYPRFRVRTRPVSPKRGRVKAKIRKVPVSQVRKRRLFAYWSRHGSARFKRLGGSRVRPAGRRAARASLRFRIPKRLQPADSIVVCVKGLARAGWGRNVGLDRRCGRRKLRDPRFKELPTRRANRAEFETRPDLLRPGTGGGALSPERDRDAG